MNLCQGLEFLRPQLNGQPLGQCCWPLLHLYFSVALLSSLNNLALVSCLGTIPLQGDCLLLPQWGLGWLLKVTSEGHCISVIFLGCLMEGPWAVLVGQGSIRRL